ncbi:MAG: phosphatase PAP2 family protein [Acidimicrobiia bacterium]
MMASLDTDVHDWFVDHRTAALDDFFRTVTHLGAAAVLLPIIVLMLAALLWKRRPDLALGAGVAVIGTWVTVNLVLKPLVGRARPPLADRLVFPGDASFPSGHAANATAAWLTLAWVLASLVERRAAKVAIWSGAGCVAALVGVSRLYLGVHWPTDVVAGWAIGGAWVACGIWLARRTRHARQPVM